MNVAIKVEREKIWEINYFSSLAERTDTEKNLDLFLKR